MLFYGNCVCVWCSVSQQHGQTHYPFWILCMLRVIFSSLLSWLLFSRRASGRALFVSCLLSSACYQTLSRTHAPTIPRPPHAFSSSRGTSHNTTNTRRLNYFGLKVAGNRWRKGGRRRGELYKHGSGRKCCATATKSDLWCREIQSFRVFDGSNVGNSDIFHVNRHQSGIFLLFSPKHCACVSKMLSNQENGY